MRSNCEMTQTVQNDDAIQVPANRNTLDAPILNIVGVDPELGFAGGETQVFGLTLALAKRGHRAELICAFLLYLPHFGRLEQLKPENQAWQCRFNFFGNFNLTLTGSAFPAGLITLRSDFLSQNEARLCNNCGS